MLSEFLKECEAVLRHCDMYYSGERCAELQRAFEELSSATTRPSATAHDGVSPSQDGMAGFSRVIVLDARRAISPAGLFDFDVFIEVIAKAITEALGLDVDMRNLHREQLSQFLKDERGILFCFFSLDHLTEDHYRQLRGLGFTQTDHRILFCGRSEFLRRRSVVFADSLAFGSAYLPVRTVQLESADEIDAAMRVRSVPRIRYPAVCLCLVYTAHGFDNRRIIEIPPSGVTLGRSPGAGETIYDRIMSRLHATILLVGNEWCLIDLGSRHGSFVNGRFCEPGQSAPLGDGSVIRLGATILVFRTAPAADLSDPDDAPPGLPLLRERREDIMLWAKRFLLEAGSPTSAWTPEAAECLVNYDWPENLRELREVVGALVTEPRSFPIERADLPKKITESTRRAVLGPPGDDVMPDQNE
jgi:hypothetical protein